MKITRLKLILVCFFISTIATAEETDKLQSESDAVSTLRVGIAQTDITPPVGGTKFVPRKTYGNSGRQAANH